MRLAEPLRVQVRVLRVNRVHTEAELVFTDRSYLHFRHDPHTHWMQSWSPGEEARIARWASAGGPFCFDAGYLEP